jgi:hypothetical protein
VAKTAARNPGVPSDYLPEYVDQAAKLCRLGATDAKIVDFFEKEWRARNDSNVRPSDSWSDALSS